MIPAGCCLANFKIRGPARRRSWPLCWLLPCRFQNPWPRPSPLVAALLVAALPISESVAPLVAALLVAAVPISKSVAPLVAKLGPPNRFQNRDGKTLSSQGLAKAPPEHAREILADDETICTSRWAKTKCDVEVKLCSRVTDLSHKLFRVEDLLSIPELNG